MATSTNKLRRKNRKALWKDTQGRCVYCGHFVPTHFPEARTADHMIPASKGGTHAKANKLPACRWCNGARGADQWPPSAIAHPDLREYVLAKEASLRAFMRQQNRPMPPTNP